MRMPLVLVTLLVLGVGCSAPGGDGAANGGEVAATDMEALRAEIKRQRNEIIIKNYFAAYVKKATSEEAIKKYYDEHQEEWNDD